MGIAILRRDQSANDELFDQRVILRNALQRSIGKGIYPAVTSTDDVGGGSNEERSDQRGAAVLAARHVDLHKRGVSSAGALHQRRYKLLASRVIMLGGRYKGQGELAQHRFQHRLNDAAAGLASTCMASQAIGDRSKRDRLCLRVQAKCQSKDTKSVLILFAGARGTHVGAYAK